MNAHRSLVVPLALLLEVATLGAAFGQEPVHSRAAFDEADAKARKAVLARIAQHDDDLPAGEAVGIITAGLHDSDREVRRQALTAVVSHSVGPAYFSGSSPERQERAREAWLTRQPSIRQLRPDIVAAFEDPDPLVRAEAVCALASLDYNGKESEPRLTPDTIRDLAGLYAREKHAYVRATVVQMFAHTRTDSAAVRRLIVNALDDPDAGARDFALMGSQRLKLPEALPKAAAALSDPNRGVRLAAATLFAAFGRGASEYEDRLVDALSTETEASVRGVIEAALREIRSK